MRLSKKLLCVRKCVRNKDWSATVRAPYANISRNPTSAGWGILSELMFHYCQFGRTWPVFSSLSDLCKGMNVIVKMETESHSLEHIWPWSKLLDTIIAPFFGQLTFFSKLFFITVHQQLALQSKLILTYSRHSRLNSFRSWHRGENWSFLSGFFPT